MPRLVRVVVDLLEREGAVTRIRLRDPEGWELPPFHAGAHIDLFLPGGSFRTYSLINPPAQSNRYEIAVREERAGRGGSTYLCNGLELGDEMGVSLPRGGFEAIPPHSRFIAGGIGITPFLSVALSLLHQERRDFVLHWITRGPAPFPDLQAPLRRAGVLKRHDTQLVGRPDLSKLLGPVDRTALVACCGSESLLESFAVATQHLDLRHIHVERFVPPTVRPDPDAAPYTLILAQSHRRIEVLAGDAMSDALRAAGVVVPVSCGGGICGACKVRWLSGTPIHRDRFLKPQDRSQFLLSCVALSAGPELVVDL
jgi:vanillate O-demethylase ferredoxin subunit